MCASVAPPSPGAQVAIVDQGGTRPTVVQFQASTQAQVQQKVAQLSQTGHVTAVGPNQLVHADNVPNPNQNPDYLPDQPDFQSAQVDFPAAWGTLDGSGVRVGVVDTGVQADHPDLNGNVVQGNDFIVGNGPTNFARVDGNGHGTHVAGTIAAADNTMGVVGGAPHATIVPARVLDCQGSGTTATVASGVEWASDQTANGGRVKVINMSLGGPGDDPALSQAITDALGRGVVVVAAAGNCGQGGAGCTAVDSSEFPGAYAGVSGFNGNGMIAAGSLDSADHRSAFSNNNTYVTVAAPGEHILSTVPFSGTPQIHDLSGYMLLSGTSMAAPHVSAVAALIFQRCGLSDSPAHVETRITSGVKTLPSPSDFASGSVGLLWADAVVSGSCP